MYNKSVNKYCKSRVFILYQPHGVTKIKDFDAQKFIETKPACNARSGVRRLTNATHLNLFLPVCNLWQSASIEAENVVLPYGKQLNIALTDTSGTDNAFTLKSE